MAGTSGGGTSETLGGGLSSGAEQPADVANDRAMKMVAARLIMTETVTRYNRHHG
jgi:hypothetical protein